MMKGRSDGNEKAKGEIRRQEAGRRDLRGMKKGKRQMGGEGEWRGINKDADKRKKGRKVKRRSN